MNENEKTILAKDNAIIERSYSTAADFRSTSYSIAFPPSVEGIKILDIGAGASTAVLELTRRGAMAVAYDIRYRNLNELKESVDSFNNSLFPLPLKEVRSSKKERHIFFDATKKSEQILVAGTAINLPFKENAFDFIYSAWAVTRFLIEDKDVFMQSIFEALRVLKPGGQLQLYPWYPKSWPSSARKGKKSLIRFLKDEKITYQIGMFSSFCLPRLRILKGTPTVT